MQQSEPSAQLSVQLAWGAVIRRYRGWKSLSRKQLAEAAGVSTVYLGEIERGQKDASSHTLALVADALGVPLAELYVRVAAHLDVLSGTDDARQPGLPMIVREGGAGYPEGVSRARDETALDLYTVARELSTEQQLALLMLARLLSACGKQT